jgi:hypothetical protein
MSHLPALDLWQVGIVRDQAAALLARGTLAGSEIVWLPNPGRFGFLADPFGVIRDGSLHVFAEAYDYRTRRGVIDVLRLDADLNLLDRHPCLEEKWHLSYPFVFEADGETWMLPEAHHSGGLTLYRATDFPFGWTAEHRFMIHAPVIDPTLFRHQDRWWLAFAPGGDIGRRQGELHLAYADDFRGPWTPHPLNPVRHDRGGARPGGSAIVHPDHIDLPVQDCSATYGGGLRTLRIRTLDPNHFEAELMARIDGGPAFAGYDGFHTLSACGPFSLVDAKRCERTLVARGTLLAGYARAMVAGQGR